MTIRETLTTTQDEIETIAAALAAPRGAVDNVVAGEELRRLVTSHWTELVDLDALLVAQDDRLSALRGMGDKSILARLGLTERYSFTATAAADDDPSGFKSTNLAGAACLLIWLERLGFTTDATELCDAVREATKDAVRVSDEERLALQYQKWRGNGPPVDVYVAPFRAPSGTLQKFTTSTGYYVEVFHDIDGAMTMITSSAPNYRDPEEE